jgi:hypothetical protein
MVSEDKRKTARSLDPNFYVFCLDTSELTFLTRLSFILMLSYRNIVYLLLGSYAISGYKQFIYKVVYIIHREHSILDTP